METQQSHYFRLVCVYILSAIMVVPMGYAEVPNSTAIGFSSPYGVAYDRSNLYVADRRNHRIQKIAISSGVVTTLAGSTTSGSTDGKGTDARFYYPSGVACDGKGNLYVVDQNNNMIRKIVISTGIVTTLAGSISNGRADGTGTIAHFSNPYGITYDVAGNLYVTDSGNNKIRKISIATGEVTTLAGSGSWSSTDGSGTTASFFCPAGIVSVGRGNLYVADLGGCKIRKIAISKGEVSTMAGNGKNGFTDGICTEASFYNPIGVASDGLGNLYVTDSGNNKIRKISITTGVVSTLAGSGSVGSTDGVGTTASFNDPIGIAYDGLGNLYVTDSGNNKIRKIVISTGIVSTL